MHSIRRHILILGALLALGFTQGNLNPATWSAKVEPGEIKAGGKGTLKLTINLDEGWHVYSLTQPPPPRALKLKLEDNDIFTQAGNAAQPKPKVKFDPNFQIDTETFDGSATFSIPFAVASTAAPGPQKVAAKVTFQVCDSERCLRPKTITVESDVKIAAAGAAGVAVAGRPQVSPTTSPSPVKREASPTPSGAAVSATPDVVEPEPESECQSRV